MIIAKSNGMVLENILNGKNMTYFITKKSKNLQQRLKLFYDMNDTLILWFWNEFNAFYLQNSYLYLCSYATTTKYYQS